MTEPQSDYDSPWKEALEYYFEAFMAFFFPQAHADIAWGRGHEFLDKELQQVVRDAELGRRLADKLVKVWRRDGQEAWVLVHIEVQGQVEADFAKRMYVYNYRLFDRFDQQVVSVAVLGDEQADWRPAEYGYALWNCRVSLQFPTVKLLDYAVRWDELEASANPFAVVVMAHLKAQATRQDINERFMWKLRLVRGLYERGFTRHDVLELFRIIDWIIWLPEELTQGFRRTMASYEEEKRMPYVTSIERLGRQEGRQEGEVSMARRSLIEVLKARFTAVSPTIVEAIDQIDNPGTLMDLLRRAVTVQRLEDFAQAI